MSPRMERTPLGADIFRRRYVWFGIAMNLARAGLPSMAWYEVSNDATSKMMDSIM